MVRMTLGKINSCKDRTRNYSSIGDFLPLWSFGCPQTKKTIWIQSITTTQKSTNTSSQSHIGNTQKYIILHRNDIRCIRLIYQIKRKGSKNHLKWHDVITSITKALNLPANIDVRVKYKIYIGLDYGEKMKRRKDMQSQGNENR